MIIKSTQKRGRPKKTQVGQCLTCGKDVFFVPSHPQFYCSRECCYKGRRLEYDSENGRICKECGIDKPLDQFKKASDGSGYYRTCIACMALNYRANKWSQRTNGTVEEWLYRFAMIGDSGVLSTLQEKKDLRRLGRRKERDRKRERLGKLKVIRRKAPKVNDGEKWCY